ncbi:hypothetical protein [Bacteroides sp. 224]|uniref:hypothetical protein n=1 Tax=Bacteroides sp. 224 TaxID=2302936 RepID=UPI0013D4A332|nr:hypothetical protein [Bacteroides sp. 224]NDV64007.1 hypothetical protein [Bacteroides sp. 224]
MKKKIIIVLINVNAVGSCGESARKVCERIEGELIDDFDNHAELSSLSFHEDDVDSIANFPEYMIYSLTDFMDEFNNEEINESNWFITWVYTYDQIEKDETNSQIMELASELAEKELVDKYHILPEDMCDGENYKEEFQDEFNSLYDKHHSQLSQLAKFEY